MRADCDWNPVVNRPALLGEPTACPKRATVVVREAIEGGSDYWHLCRSCAGLPRFRALKQKPLVKP